jgi:transcriptional regulator with XRE-family HTH domain
VAFFTNQEAGPVWASRYRCEWGQVVGRRVRVLRQQRGLLIWQLAAKLYRADGKPYSPSFVSRLERGWASAPLWVYIRLADLFAVTPGELLGENGVERLVSDAELTMVRVARQLGLSPEEAIAQMTKPRAPAAGSDSRIRG